MGVLMVMMISVVSNMTFVVALLVSFITAAEWPAEPIMVVSDDTVPPSGRHSGVSATGTISERYGTPLGDSQRQALRFLNQHNRAQQLMNQLLGSSSTIIPHAQMGLNS